MFGVMSSGPWFISGLLESEPNTVMAEIEYVRKQSRSQVTVENRQF